MKRHDGRTSDQLRKNSVAYGVFEHADGSALIKMGKTTVLCSVMIANGVPPFLRNQGKGWLTAEYALLPASTMYRSGRESSGKRNGRSVEISRLIGRSLRAVVDLSVFGERTIHIDCDVLHADGGTRAAAITGAYLALRQADLLWQERGVSSASIMIDELAAISVGVKQDQILLDIDYAEDSSIDADFNFVLTRSGAVIEMQGASEGQHVSWQQVNGMYEVAHKGVMQLLDAHATIPNDSNKIRTRAPGGFTLGARLVSQKNT